MKIASVFRRIVRAFEAGEFVENTLRGLSLDV